MYSLIKGIARQPDELLDLFTTVAATPSKTPVDTCDKCSLPTYMPVIVHATTYCIACYIGRSEQSPTLPPPYPNRVCECGSEKAGSYGHSTWCPKY